MQVSTPAGHHLMDVELDSCVVGDDA